MLQRYEKICIFTHFFLPLQNKTAKTENDDEQEASLPADISSPDGVGATVLQD
jgi:hypothetical protein